LEQESGVSLRPMTLGPCPDLSWLVQVGGRRAASLRSAAGHNKSQCDRLPAGARIAVAPGEYGIAPLPCHPARGGARIGQERP